MHSSSTSHASAAAAGTDQPAGQPSAAISPLQAFGDRLTAASGPQMASTSSSALAPLIPRFLGELSRRQLRDAEDWGQRKRREWVWFDEVDEREEMKKELRKAYPTAGHVYLTGVPQSQKKVDRILQLVRRFATMGAAWPCMRTRDCPMLRVMARIRLRLEGLNEGCTGWLGRGESW